MRTLVSLDIETTGLDSERDAILEIGLVKFRGDEVLDEWSSIIDPQRPIPPKIAELTHITDEMVQREGMALWDGLRTAQSIVGGVPIIGHNILFDLGFLRQHKVFVNNQSLDTFELASILVPHAGRYSLGALTAELGIKVGTVHRALDDARLAHQLYLKVFQRAIDLPREVIDEISKQADLSGWVLSDFWRDVREEQGRGSFATNIGAAIKAKLIETRQGATVQRSASASKLMARKAQLAAKPLKPSETQVALDVDKAARALATEGPFSKKFPGYEARPQQVDMLRQVVKTFNEGGAAFIEAGTGTGKCLTGDALVTFRSGRQVSIARIVDSGHLPSEPIVSLDASHKLTFQRITGLHNNGIRPVWQLTTASGKTITATANHPFLTPEGWQRLDVLSVGDSVATPRYLPGQTATKVAQPLERAARLLGARPARALPAAVVTDMMSTDKSPSQHDLCDPMGARLAESHVHWDRIVAIDFAGHQPTYDLTMAGEPNFVANGIVVHNSLAYLIPSMMWALQNSERVVISTNTINLQEQLADKDVPSIIDILGQEARAAVMKGKGRYLCPNRFADLRRNGPKTTDEARVLTKILIWLPNTLTGDADELFIPSPGERAVFQHLSAQNPICNMNTCSATDCFFHQARRLAESAHVVIVNHALLLADIAVENRALPEYKYLVVDEAHHLEAAATDSLTYEIDREEMQRQLTELGRASQTRRASGVLAEIAAKSRQLLKPDQGAAIDTQCDAAMLAATSTWTSNSAAFDELNVFIADESSDKNDYTQRVRLTRALRSRAGWSRIEQAFEKLVTDLNAMTKSLNTIFKGLSDMSELIADFDMLVSRLNGAIRFFVDAAEQLNGMILKPQDDKIYWVDIDMNRRGNRAPKVVLNVAPLNVGPMMKRQLFDTKNAVVMTSATIRTSGANGKSQPTFDYIKGRLSAEDAQTLALGSPFDYKANTLVYLPTDMPEPNQQGYQQAVERGLIELFKTSGGRGLALFTSYTQLKATARVIGPALQREDILVFEQGDGTSRRAMIEGFRNAERAVMLGTKSFWEGVDIQGEKLSALAICKLPFDVPTDPIFAARSETFENAFNDYSVPETVLRFRQGFGRLIRSKTDRGVVAVFDKRVITKGYGNAFLNALPGPTVVRAPLGQMAKLVGEWLARTPNNPAGTIATVQTTSTPS